MNIDSKILQYGKYDINDLCMALESLPDSAWRESEILRSALVGERPGQTIYLLNNVHHRLRKDANAEFAQGVVNVMRFPLWHTFKEFILPITNRLPDRYRQCSAVRVQIAKLFPSEEIAPHIDNGYLTLMHRLHIPLVTDDDIDFQVDEEVFHLKTGYLYELNNTLEHAVYNRSSVPRVHLLIDLLPESTGQVCYHDDLASMSRGSTGVFGDI